MHQNEWFQVWFFKNFLGRGSPSPLPRPLPTLFLGLRPRFGLRPQFSSASRPRLGLRPRYSGASRPRFGLRPQLSIGDLGLAPPKINFWIRPCHEQCSQFQLRINIYFVELKPTPSFACVSGILHLSILDNSGGVHVHKSVFAKTLGCPHVHLMQTFAYECTKRRILHPQYRGYSPGLSHLRTHSFALLTLYQNIMRGWVVMQYLVIVTYSRLSPTK